MLHNMSNQLTEKLVITGIITSERKRVYAYGLELLIASICGIGVLILISLIFKKPFMWLSYLIAFIPMRLNAGGFHAKSHFWCIISFSSLYTVLIAVSSYISHITIIPVIISLICIVLVLIFAPIETKNNPLKAGREPVCRRNSILLSILNLILSLSVFIFLDNVPSILIGYFSGLTAAVIFFIIVIFESICERRNSL